MTRVQTSGEREAIRPRMIDCACGENPRPPCSLEMSMPRKPFRFTKSQISAGTSLLLKRMVQSLTMRQSSLVGPSIKACSSAVRVIGGTARSLSQSGVPGEQLGVKADGARIECGLLGCRDFRQNALDRLEQGRNERGPPDRRYGQEGERGNEKPADHAEETGFESTSLPPQQSRLPNDERCRQRDRPAPQGRTPHRQEKGSCDTNDEKNQLRH